jgi:hypothetical protein
VFAPKDLNVRISANHDLCQVLHVRGIIGSSKIGHHAGLGAFSFFAAAQNG